jgi:malate synthase
MAHGDNSIFHSRGKTMTTAIKTPVVPAMHPEVPADRVLSPAVMDFLEQLDLRFEAERQNMLNRRKVRQAEFDKGILPDFLPDTEASRHSAWSVAPAPDELQDHRVEITGPTDRKMVINALNSGARVFMADFEDSTAPTWNNVVEVSEICTTPTAAISRTRRPRASLTS